MRSWRRSGGCCASTTCAWCATSPTMRSSSSPRGAIRPGRTPHDARWERPRHDRVRDRPVGTDRQRRRVPPSVRPSGRRSRSRGASGAPCLPARAGSRLSRRTPKRGWRRSRSWWRRRSRMPRAARASPGWPRSRRRCGAWRRWWRAGRRRRRCSRRSPARSAGCFRVDVADLGRYEPDGTVTSSSPRWGERVFAVGARVALGGDERHDAGARDRAVRHGSTSYARRLRPDRPRRPREAGHSLGGRRRRSSSRATCGA